MNNKVVIITGAAGDIGIAIAESFAASGYRVILLDIDGTRLSNAVKRIENFKGKTFTCDVTDENSIVQIIRSVYEQFGRIDVLVNNAGLQHIAPIEEFPTEKFRFMLELMLTAPFIAVKHVLPYMKSQDFGRIINMASINGLIGFAGKVAYNSAKHGLIGLTKVVALETATRKITVNAVCPGYVDSELVRKQLSDLAALRGISKQNVLEEVIYPLVPQKRLLDANEVANVVAFLADEKSGGITGQCFVIDGGYTVQ